MKFWQCEVFANEALTLPCAGFIGRFASAEKAMEALQHELSVVQVLLYPGAMRETTDDGSFTDNAPFRMVRLSSVPL